MVERRGTRPMEVPATSPRSVPELLDRVRSGGPVVVALSGGVDSGVVADVAHRALGLEAVAVTLVGAAVSREEVERAQLVAARIGIDHALVPAEPLEVPEYRANPAGRCYFCRRTEMTALTAWANDRGIHRILDGIHVDDLGDDRPGLRALEEAGVGHPLLWAGWRKVEVRSYAREACLPNWDQPSEACLASRVAHGRPISLDLLVRIERAEEELHHRGFRRVRVRTDGVDARVVVDPDEVERLLAEPSASEIRRSVAAAGFRSVILDPDGYGPRPGA
jgi:pyridinium-3,5-biscarboxylic acid mononucleotide sulfurtransferase